MKKLAIIVAAIVYSIASLWAQEPTPRKDTIATFKVENSDDVVLSSNDGTLAINIAGYSITLAERKEKEKESSSRQLTLTQSGFAVEHVEYVDPNDPKSEVKQRTGSKVTFASNSKIGLIALTTPDYSAYQSGDEGFMDLRLSKSIYYGLDLVGLRTKLDSKGVVTLKTGINLMCYNFSFDGDITLDYQNGVITPIALDGDQKKSKLTTAYVAIPLSIAFDLSDHFTLEPGLYAGLIVNSHTKYKFPKTKSDYMGGVNQAIGGVSLTATYQGIGLYCNYNLTTLFEEGRGPDTQAISFGVGFKL